MQSPFRPAATKNNKLCDTCKIRKLTPLFSSISTHAFLNEVQSGSEFRNLDVPVTMIRPALSQSL